jgi:AhpD family alkylhydroperoxidase
MINLDRRTARLIAVGASVAANCQTCLKAAAVKAGQDGIKEKDIAEAIEIGNMVRHCAASNMDEFAASISRAAATSSSQAATEGACECAPLKKQESGKPPDSNGMGIKTHSGR